MAKYFFPIVVLIIIAFGGILYWQRHFASPPPAICSVIDPNHHPRCNLFAAHF